MRRDERPLAGVPGRAKKSLTPEDEAWQNIAERVGCSVQRAKAETTVSEFFKWKARFEKEVNEFHREDWLFAQVAWIIDSLPARFFGYKFDRKLEQYLMKFVTRQKDKLTGESAPAEEAQALKTAFLAAFGFDPKGNLTRPLKTRLPPRQGPKTASQTPPKKAIRRLPPKVRMPVKPPPDRQKKG